MLRQLSSCILWGMVSLLCAAVMLQPAQEWSSPWSRQPGQADLSQDSTVAWQGRATDRVTHRGSDDWSISFGPQLGVLPGELYVFSGQIRLKGNGNAGASVVSRKGEDVLAWTLGHNPISESDQWRRMTVRLVVPFGVTSFSPRLTGYGPSQVWLADWKFERIGKVPVLDPKGQPWTLKNKLISAQIAPGSLAMKVQDLRSGKVWTQEDRAGGLIASSAKAEGNQLQVRAFGSGSHQPMTLTYSLAPERPEIDIKLEGQPTADLDVIDFPPAFESRENTVFYVPLNMGIRWEAKDKRVSDQWLPGWSGHGLCMGFWGAQEGSSSVLTIIKDLDDFMLRLTRVEGGLLTAHPSWHGEKKRMGYPRRLTYCFFEKGGYVEMAKRYRAHAKEAGLYKSLKAKIAENPNVAKVVGALNLWTWSGEKVQMAQEAKAMWMNRTLWSGGGSPDELKEILKLGFVTSRYDIYQDVMDPARHKDLPYVHPDWTTDAWPKDLCRNESQDWVRGWMVQDKQGKDVPCGVLCDSKAVPYAQKRTGEELKTHPYQARFIDTTTASEWRECWDPDHPMTRRQSRDWKMRLLSLFSKDFRLVTGSETGHEASVPHLVFFEGMMSLGPYRVPDAGTDPPKIYETLPQNVTEFQLDPAQRVPLWQLVYGDCTVSTWYWGDFNHKHLGTWDVRDKLNALYGTSPMFFTDLAGLKAQRARFIQSYKATVPIAEKVGLSEMVSHAFLTPDRKVQESRWANGASVLVNFSPETWSGKGALLRPGEVKFLPGKE